MARTYQAELGQDLKQGFDSLGSLFAPPTPQGLVAQSSIAKTQADLAARATMNEHFANGTATIADYGTAGAPDPVKGYIMGRLFDYSQAHPDAPLPTYDSGVYIMGGDVSKTAAGQQAAPLSDNQSRMLSPGFARALGVPTYQHGVLDLGKNAKMMPGSGKTDVVSAPDSGSDDNRKWGVVGEDKFGNKLYGYPPKLSLTPDTGTPLPGGTALPTGGTPAQSSGIDPNLHGDAFLKTLPPDIGGQVRSIIEGRTPYPTGFLLAKPFGQQLATYVTQADPSFEAGNAAARVHTRNEFTSGGPNSPAGSITAGNTALQHLGDLSDQAELLGNGSIPLVNRGANFIKTQTGGGVPLTSFNNALGRFTEEATKFYRGVGGTETDIQRAIDALNPNQSPDQLHAAIKTQAELMAAKITALQDRWHTGMGPMNGDFPIVGKTAQGALDRIRQRGGDMPVGGGAAQQPQGSSIANGPGGSSAAASAGAAGPSAQAAPGAPGALGAPQAQGQGQPPMAGARQAPDGKWYVPDPNRQGKYLRVEPAAAETPARGQATNPQEAIAMARDAIARGAPRDAVLRRLQSMGVDFSGAGI